jgi:hypothetical protein
MQVKLHDTTNGELPDYRTFGLYAGVWVYRLDVGRMDDLGDTNGRCVEQTMRGLIRAVTHWWGVVLFHLTNRAMACPNSHVVVWAW